jgi:hypothetical protein
VTFWLDGQNVRRKDARPGCHRPRDASLRDARRGLPGCDYGNGPYVLPALRQPPVAASLSDYSSGSGCVRFGVRPERDRRAPTR